MRVVQVLTQDGGGPVDHAVDVARALAERGHDSHVLGPGAAGEAAAVAAGVTWHRTTVRDKRDAAGAAQAVRRLRALDADVVHGHDRRAGWLTRVLAPSLRGRCVYTLHGVPDGLSDLVRGNLRAAPRRRRDRLYYLHGERLVTRWSRGAVVTPSQAVAEYAVRHVGVPQERVHVVPNGVDERRWAPSGDPGGGDDRPVVAAWVGLLGEVKRTDVLLDAVARVEGVRLVLAGDGPMREQVRLRTRRDDLDGRVELLGPVRDVRAVLARADLLVSSSAAENLPLSVLQAMASGLPVVATSVGGVPELVRDGVDGWLVPPGDADALAAALADAVVSRERLAARGTRARERVCSGWTLDACVERLLAVYESRG